MNNNGIDRKKYNYKKRRHQFDTIKLENTNRLRHIAKLCPYIYGTSVYQARAILAGIEPLITEYWSDCEIPHDPEDNNQRTMKNFEKPFAGRLYPNPNDGKMQLDYELQNISQLAVLFLLIRKNR